MRSTRRGFVPDPKPCAHCGRVLSPLTADLNGRTVFAGWEPCGCPGAQAARAEWEAERRRGEEAAALAAWERKIEQSGIPPRYREATHPWAARLAQRVSAGDGIYLHGRNGSGKTTLACAAALICLRNGLSVRFAVASKLLAGLAKCDLLVVDDLGKEGAATPRAAEKLFDLFNDRYNEQTMAHPRPIIVTSNFPRNDVANRVSQGGAGVAIASRLKETTDDVVMDDKDWRLQ